MGYCWIFWLVVDHCGWFVGTNKLLWTFAELLLVLVGGSDRFDSGSG